MRYVDSFETGKKAILEKHPELINSNFEADNSGWTNYVIKADRKYLFRFPRNNEAYKSIKKEHKILKILNKKLPDYIKVPNYIYSSLDTDYPYVGYKLIDGVFLTQEIFVRLSNRNQNKTIDCISEFLNILHSIDYRDLNLTITDPIEQYSRLYKSIQDVCYKYFDDELKEQTTKLFKNFFNDETMYNYKPTLVHGDLSGDHILVTDDGIGIIDFGDLMVFDPAYDLIWSYSYGTNFYQVLLNKYSGPKDDYFEHRIRDFHIIRPPYNGIIYADEINDKQMLERKLNDLRENLKQEENNAGY